MELTTHLRRITPLRWAIALVVVLGSVVMLGRRDTDAESTTNRRLATDPGSRSSVLQREAGRLEYQAHRIELATYAQSLSRSVAAKGVPYGRLIIDSLGMTDPRENTGELLMPSPATGPSCVLLLPRLPRPASASATPSGRRAAERDLERAIAQRRNSVKFSQRLCGFIERHGAPGTVIGDWLASTEFAALAVSPYDEEDARITETPGVTFDRTPRRRDQNVQGLSLAMAQCARGELQGCTTGLHALERPSSSRVVLLTPWESYTRKSALTVDGGSFLERLENEIGPERFATLWKADGTLEARYADIVGEPLTMTVQRWLRRDTDGMELRRVWFPSYGLWIGALLALTLTAALADRRTLRI